MADQKPSPQLDMREAKDRAMRFLVTIQYADTVAAAYIGGEALELLAIMFQSAFSEGVIAGARAARSSDEFERRQRERFETALAEREQLCGRRTGLLASPDPGK